MEDFHFVTCSCWGARLCVETDSYRFDENGQPICYDCCYDEDQTED